MSNLRLIPINHADAATLSASSAALPVTQLQTTGRTAVWRAASTSATLTATFAGPKTVDSVALMTSNLSSAATWRARMFAGAATLYDSGTVLACPPRPFGELDWGFEPLGVNAFAFGLAAQSVLWLPARYAPTSVQIDIDDPYNPAGYVEASRLVIGERWEPEKNHSWGALLSFEERGKQSRAEDGSLRSEPGVKLRSLKLSLDWMKEPDRARFGEITRRLGTKTDFLISVYPADASADKEAHYTLVAKFIRPPGIGNTRYNTSASQVELEEI